jgi:hypothetical protein
MTVVPSLISHPAVPSHRRMTWPSFSVLGRFCVANPQIPVAAKAKNASVDFTMRSPRSAGFAQSLAAQGNWVNDYSWARQTHQRKGAEIDSAPSLSQL